MAWAWTPARQWATRVRNLAATTNLVLALTQDHLTEDQHHHLTNLLNIALINLRKTKPKAPDGPTP